MMLSKIQSVIKEVYPTLSLLQDDFFIIGSSALVLAGIEIENTSDIDILTSNKNAEFLRNIWQDKRVKEYVPKQSDLFCSNFARYNFGALDIEVLGELKVQKNNIWERLIIQDYTIVSNDGFEVKIPTTKEFERILKLFGRKKDLLKLDLLEKYTAKLINSE